MGHDNIVVIINRLLSMYNFASSNICKQMFTNSIIIKDARDTHLLHASPLDWHCVTPCVGHLMQEHEEGLESVEERP